VADAGLADLPAQKDDFRPEHAGKIDQTLFHTFADAAVTVNRFNPALDFAHEPGDFSVLAQPLHQVGRVGIEALFTNDGFTFAFQTPEVF
jgi:hypothetical protein